MIELVNVDDDGTIVLYLSKSFMNKMLDRCEDLRAKYFAEKFDSKNILWTYDHTKRVLVLEILFKGVKVEVRLSEEEEVELWREMVEKSEDVRRMVERVGE